MTINPPRERYFVIVIKGDDSMGSVLCASTELGNKLRACERELLPLGFTITRSIEVTKNFATEGIR